VRVTPAGSSDVDRHNGYSAICEQLASRCTNQRVTLRVHDGSFRADLDSKGAAGVVLCTVWGLNSQSQMSTALPLIGLRDQALYARRGSDGRRARGAFRPWRRRRARRCRKDAAWFPGQAPCYLPSGVNFHIVARRPVRVETIFPAGAHTAEWWSLRPPGPANRSTTGNSLRSWDCLPFSVDQRGRHIPSIRLTGEYVEVERLGRRRARAPCLSLNLPPGGPLPPGV